MFLLPVSVSTLSKSLGVFSTPDRHFLPTKKTSLLHHPVDFWIKKDDFQKKWSLRTDKLNKTQLTCSRYYFILYYFFFSDLYIYCIFAFSQLFRKLILACLNQAMEDGATSLCFPTIGTGYLMYKPEVSAKNMLQAITEFANNNPSSAIAIYIVLYKREDSLRKNLKVSTKKT